MDDNARAEANRTWEALKPDIEALAVQITAFYEALGSTRHCRHINELWHPENAGIGIGFVPPEALARLEALVISSGLKLHKSNGPLGKGVYFSFLYEHEFTQSSMKMLGEQLTKETLALKDAPVQVTAPKLTAEEKLDAEVARMEGRLVARPEKVRVVPSEVSDLVKSFNAAVKDCSVSEALKRLTVAIDFFALPDITKKELLRTIEMMRDAETGPA